MHVCVFIQHIFRYYFCVISFNDQNKEALEEVFIIFSYLGNAPWKNLHTLSCIWISVTMVITVLIYWIVCGIFYLLEFIDFVVFLLLNLLFDMCHSEQLMALIGEQFDESDEICGVVVSARQRQDKVALWTKTASNEAVQVCFLHWNHSNDFVLYVFQFVIQYSTHAVIILDPCIVLNF